MADFIGDSGDNSIVGSADMDDIDVSQGGHDTVKAGGGDDSVYFGGAYTSADVADGGAGSNDDLFLRGDYSHGVTVDVTHFEGLVLGSGAFDYKLTLAADCFVVGGTFSISAGALLN